MPSFNGKITLDIHGGGDPRFVVQNKEGHSVKVYAIDKLDIKMMRLVVKKLGFEPNVPLLPIKEIDELWNADPTLETKTEQEALVDKYGFGDADL